MNDANRDRDCLPDPPTPTSKALPLGLSKIREILEKILKSLKKIIQLIL